MNTNDLTKQASDSSPAAPVVDRTLYSELIHIAAELARGDGFLSTCAEDMSPRLKRADILKTAEGQEYRLKEWANRVRQVADKLAAAASTASTRNYYEQALTVNWEATNARRLELITKKPNERTGDEANELRELQWLAGIKRELGSGPLPASTQEDAESILDGLLDNKYFEQWWADLDSHAQDTIKATLARVTAAPSSQPAIDAAREIAHQINGGDRTGGAYPPALAELLDDCSIVNEEKLAQWLESIISRYFPEPVDQEANPLLPIVAKAAKEPCRNYARGCPENQPDESYWCAPCAARWSTDAIIGGCYSPFPEP